MANSEKPWAVRWAESGAYGRWFGWIEALGLTAGVFVLALKAQHWLIQVSLSVLGVVCAVFACSWAFGWALQLLVSRLPKLSLSPILARAVAAAIAIPFTGFMGLFLGLVLAGFLQ